MTKVLSFFTEMKARKYSKTQNVISDQRVFLCTKSAKNHCVLGLAPVTLETSYHILGFVPFFVTVQVNVINRALTMSTSGFLNFLNQNEIKM